MLKLLSRILIGKFNYNVFQIANRLPLILVELTEQNLLDLLGFRLASPPGK